MNSKTTFYSLAIVISIGLSYTTATKACSTNTKALADYSAEDLKVINFVADVLKKYDGNLIKASAELDPDKIANELKIDLKNKKDDYIEYIQPGIITVLNGKGVDMNKLNATSNCAKFAACSVDHNLAAASGEELERYTKEKAEDGRYFDNWKAPDFRFKAPNGEIHALSDYRGKKVALMLFAAHCNHCFATIPMLSELNEAFKTSDLQIIPVYVNKKGIVKEETIKYFTEEYDIDYDLMISLDKNISEAYNARMVPSTFLIDEDGFIIQKFVGQQEKTILADAFGTFLKKSS